MMIEGKVPIYPTEDPDRIVQCIMNIFPLSDIVRGEDEIVFSSPSAQQLVILLEEQRIRDTAAMVFRRAMMEDATSFFLNKQAAFVGKVNFTEGRSSLGDIRVDVLKGASELIRDLAL
jgi:hypothetical protein